MVKRAMKNLTRCDQSRLDRLAPIDPTTGRRVPRWIRCYFQDNCWDGYTVVYTRTNDGWSHGVGMSTDPYHPQGFGQHFEYENGRLGNGQWAVDRPKSAHLGKRIRFLDMPPQCQRLVLSDYAEMRSLPLDELMKGLS